MYGMASNVRFHPSKEVSEERKSQRKSQRKRGFHPSKEVSEVLQCIIPKTRLKKFPSL